MSIDLRSYSAQKIGATWTEADHQYVLQALARIDDVCMRVWQQIRDEERERPKRIDELLAAGDGDSERPDG
jgi:cytochrome P450